MASRVSCVVTHISLARSGESQVQAYGHHVCASMRRARSATDRPNRDSIPFTPLPSPRINREICPRNVAAILQPGVTRVSIAGEGREVKERRMADVSPISLNQRSQN